MESRERTKLYIVIGLSAVFVAVGYFRFIHGKITYFNKPERGVAIPVAVEVPAVDLKGVPTAAEQKIVPEGVRAGLRDIFAPVKAPPVEAANEAAIETAAETAAEIPSVALPPVTPLPPLPPLPPLKLMGTIVGGRQPLAVINGRFLRTGESISGFEVVSIARDHVILSGEGREVLLHTLTGAEERSP
jgi:hypothetical protein